jgi:hypothetical protein
MDTSSPTEEFAKIDQMLARKTHQTPQDRARDIEGAVDLMRTLVKDQ